MPIIDLTLVVPAGAELPPGLAQRAADAAASALGCAPGCLWLRLHALPADRYAENGGLPDDGGGPVFATVMHAAPPTGDALLREVAALTQALAACTGRSADRVHLEYAAAGAGRVAFGGRLVGG